MTRASQTCSYTNYCISCVVLSSHPLPQLCVITCLPAKNPSVSQVTGWTEIRNTVLWQRLTTELFKAVCQTGPNKRDFHQRYPVCLILSDNTRNKKEQSITHNSSWQEQCFSAKKPRVTRATCNTALHCKKKTPKASSLVFFLQRLTLNVCQLLRTRGSRPFSGYNNNSTSAAKECKGNYNSTLHRATPVSAVFPWVSHRLQATRLGVCHTL